MSSSGTSGSASTVVLSEPYAPSQPALNQIISEAGKIYGQGTGYVPPTALTLEGIAQQEALSRAGYSQVADTVAGKFQNPFLSSLIQQAAKDAYTNVATQFSGAGRTPTSMMAQSEAISKTAQAALPFAFQAYENERQRQLSTAQQLPTLTGVGQTLEGYEQQRLAAPMTNLTNYANIINSIARGGSATTTLPPAPNRLGLTIGGLLAGGSVLSQGGILGPMGRSTMDILTGGGISGGGFGGGFGSFNPYSYFR